MDRAALDVAIELGIPCGGWCPKGRKAEDGPIPDQYPLKEYDLISADTVGGMLGGTVLMTENAVAGFGPWEETILSVTTNLPTENQRYFHIRLKD